MKFEQFAEVLPSDEAELFGFPHLCQVPERHVLTNVIHNGGGDLVGVLQPIEDCARDRLAGFLMPKCRRSAIFLEPEDGRFADIVKERAECEGETAAWFQSTEKSERVNKDVAFRVMLRILWAPVQGMNLWKNDGQ
jgi:hypothetical protein